ncbi:MAG: hypothetical protein Roseis2KO_34880 [Roseivirga sp.]
MANASSIVNKPFIPFEYVIFESYLFELIMFNSPNYVSKDITGGSASGKNTELPIILP